ncbi:MAG: N-acetyl-alpha-D-glucosaminyl L-malate synthase BshA [Clostridia bacterium]|nr:N-acetyl-alpha-D-glucosaminyl L-malate synthase BshA [Clostridia bacterium]
MRIGIVCYPTFGGSGVVAAELALELARRGHEVHLISYARPARLPAHVSDVHFHPVRVPEYPLFPHPPYVLALANRMVAVARQEGVRLFHVHYAIPHATAAWLARQVLEAEAEPGVRLRVVTTLHGTDTTLLGEDPSFYDVLAFSLAQSDAVTAVSRFLAAETTALFHLPEPVCVIPNFVDPRRVRRLPVARALCGPDERLVVHVSNFRPVKRVPQVVAVFAQVAKHLPCRLALVGDGPEREIALAEARRAGVGDRVIFLGEQTDVVGVLSQADLFLLPSAQESFGLAALEAMACQVPVVASRVGGLPELVEDGVTGYLCPPDDLACFIRRSLAVLLEPDHARALGREARRRVLERYAAEDAVSRYEDLYAAVAARGDGRETRPSPCADFVPS